MMSLAKAKGALEFLCDCASLRRPSFDFDVTRKVNNWWGL